MVAVATPTAGGYKWDRGHHLLVISACHHCPQQCQKWRKYLLWKLIDFCWYHYWPQYLLCCIFSLVNTEKSTGRRGLVLELDLGIGHLWKLTVFWAQRKLSNKQKLLSCTVSNVDHKNVMRKQINNAMNGMVCTNVEQWSLFLLFVLHFCSYKNKTTD